jgi:hypothetical protein
MLELHRHSLVRPRHPPITLTDRPGAARLSTLTVELAWLIVNLHFMPRSANVGRLLLSDKP